MCVSFVHIQRVKKIILLISIRVSIHRNHLILYILYFILFRLLNIFQLRALSLSLYLWLRLLSYPRFGFLMNYNIGNGLKSIIFWNLIVFLSFFCISNQFIPH